MGKHRVITTNDVKTQIKKHGVEIYSTEALKEFMNSI